MMRSYSVILTTIRVDGWRRRVFIRRGGGGEGRVMRPTEFHSSSDELFPKPWTLIYCFTLDYKNGVETDSLSSFPPSYGWSQKVSGRSCVQGPVHVETEESSVIEPFWCINIPSKSPSTCNDSTSCPFTIHPPPSLPLRCTRLQQQLYRLTLSFINIMNSPITIQH